MVFSGQRGFISRHWGSSGWISYTFGLVSAWVALSLWAISSLMHDTPFSLFVAAVVVTARFAGFGPALLCTVVSALFLDYFVFLPGFAFSTSSADLQRLAVFLGISVVVGSLARQRSRAERRAEQTQQQMAAIVECSDDAIFSTNSEGMITSWNRGAETLYQYPADEVLGRHAFGCRLFRRCSPRRKIPQTNESKCREVMVDGRARRQRTSCLEATFEPFAGTRVCHK